MKLIFNTKIQEKIYKFLSKGKQFGPYRQQSIILPKKSLFTKGQKIRVIIETEDKKEPLINIVAFWLLFGFSNYWLYLFVKGLFF